MPTAFVSHPACHSHQPGPDHPECPERLSVIHDRLVAEGVLDFLRLAEAPEATREQLQRVHAASYIEGLMTHAPKAGWYRIDAETVLSPGTIDAALRAAGAAVLATDLVLTGQVCNAFCSVRPPGHHATRNEAMGFCFLNNVAIGVAHALEAHGLRRIAIIDFDAHHGNGTEDIFRADPRVLLCSAYQRNLFPERRESPPSEQVIWVELPPEADGKTLQELVARNWSPALEQFRPEMIYVSAGFDGHAADTMSDLRFGDEDYRWITSFLMEAAQRHAEGRVVSVLEGGYELSSLARCAALHIRTLMGI